MAGTARGRRLVAPAGGAVRPTTDRIREATFNALGSLDAVRGASVVDLFAGTGALGIEALSRGADRAVFVERSPEAIRAVRANLAATDLEDSADVVAGDATRWVPAPGVGVDLVLADPPYAFEDWSGLVDHVARWAPGALLVAESDRSPVADDDPRLVRLRRYGGTVVAVLRLPAGDDGPGPDGPAPGHPAADPSTDPSTTEDPT